MSRLEWSQLKELNSAWLACEVLPAKAIEPLTRCVNRWAEVAAELKVFADDRRYKEVRKEIVAKLAAGDLTTSGAILDLAALTSGTAAVSTTNSASRWIVLRDEVSAALRREAEDFVRSADLHSIFRDIQDGYSKRQKELHALIGDTNPDAVVRAGGKTAKAWIELQDLGKKVAPLGHVYVALQRCFLLPREAPAEVRELESA